MNQPSGAPEDWLRFGAEQDHEIAVLVTGTSEHHCFRLVLGDISVAMHARSMVDLLRKVNLALLDWHVGVCAIALQLIEAEKREQ